MTVYGPDRKPAKLERGDVITHVGGRGINTVSEYYHAMYLAGARNGKMKLSVILVESAEFERPQAFQLVVKPIQK
jgi:hypothetical protein